MPYIVRFVQRYRPEHRDRFLRLEAGFASLERSRPDLPKGRRLQPFSGRHAGNTLIWEAEFPSLAEAERAIATLSHDSDHEALFREQAPYMLDAYTEIDEVLRLDRSAGEGS